MRPVVLSLLAVLLLAAPAGAAIPQSCPGAPIRADRVLTGEVATDLQGGYVLAGFDVPQGATALRVRYCFDQPEVPTPAGSNTLDLGIYEPPATAGKLWGAEEFRGWAGSELRDVIISPAGFGDDARYLKDKRTAEPGTTSRGYLPGPVPAGRWAAELGLAALISPALGNTDGLVGYRVEVEIGRDPIPAAARYAPPPVDTRPVRAEPGWYTGDFHVHSEHSLAAPYAETFDYAFGARAQGRPDLDFVALSEHNTTAQERDVAKLRARYPGRLILRSNEVTTYRGHANIAGAVGYHDYRTGPVYERRDDGRLELRRAGRPAADLFRSAHRRGALTQINHPTIFAGAGNLTGLCRGCSWDYPAVDTGDGELDAIEVANGVAGSGTDPQVGANPFTLGAIDFWDRKLAAGARIAAVGGSDSHTAGRAGSPIEAPIGLPTTVVYAEELSEAGIVCGVRAGHTFVKVTGPDAPDLRLEARGAGIDGGAPALMGDTVNAASAAFTARVLGGDGRTLQVVRDGTVVAAFGVSGDDARIPFAGDVPGAYRLTLLNGSTIEGLSSPLYLRPAAGTPQVDRRDCRPLAASGRVRARVHAKPGTLPVRCTATGASARRCTVVARARLRLKRGGRLALRTIGRGTTSMREGERTVRLTLTKTGRRAVRAKGRRGLRTRFEFTVTGQLGDRADAVRHARLVRPAP